MPAAVAPCNGSLRHIPVSEFNRHDEMECPFCTLTPKGCKRIEVPYDKKFYEVPNHRPAGQREAKKIDWSNPL